MGVAVGSGLSPRAAGSAARPQAAKKAERSRAYRILFMGEILLSEDAIIPQMFPLRGGA
jgi:hypothetical protein